MIYIQMIGFLAFCILVLSFYKKDIKSILTYQVTANLLYAVHYFLLGALTGAFVNAINMIRNIVFLRTKKRIFVVIFLILYIVVTILFYENIYSLAPLLATACYLVFMPLGKRKYLLIGQIMSDLLWLLYSVFVLSYSGIITEIILIVSNSIQLKKNKD